MKLLVRKDIEKLIRKGIISNLVDADVQLQQTGLDLTVKSIDYINRDYGASIDFDNSHRVLAKFEKDDATPLSGEFEVLMRNCAAVLTLNEIFDLPDNITGMMFSRSSLLRCGVTMNHALVDPGYKGDLRVSVMSPVRIRVYKNARVCQIVFFEHEKTKKYDGMFNNLKDLPIDANSLHPTLLPKGGISGLPIDESQNGAKEAMERTAAALDKSKKAKTDYYPDCTADCDGITCAECEANNGPISLEKVPRIGPIYCGDLDEWSNCDHAASINESPVCILPHPGTCGSQKGFSIPQIPENLAKIVEGISDDKIKCTCWKDGVCTHPKHEGWTKCEGNWEGCMLGAPLSEG